MFEARHDLAQHPVMHEWAAHNRPLIVRMGTMHERAQGQALAQHHWAQTVQPLIPLSVGIALPPAQGKARVALTVLWDDVAQWLLPPLLTETAHIAPEAWRETLNSLQQAATSYEVELRVFGSLAWESLTGLSYVTHTSDIDLLWLSPKRTRLDALLSTLAAIDATAPMALDGEVVWPDGRAVNWREWHSGADEVIVKGPHGLSMANRDALEQALM